MIKCGGPRAHAFPLFVCINRFAYVLLRATRRESRDPRAPLDLQDLLVRRVHKVRLVCKVRLESRAQLGPKDRLENLAPLDQQDLKAR